MWCYQFDAVQWNYEGESNENLKYFLSCNLLNTEGTQWLFFYVVSIVFHTSVLALRKCTHTCRKKILAEGAATSAQPAAPSSRTWKTWLPLPLWAVERHESLWGGEVWWVRRMWKTLARRIVDCCNSWLGNLGSSIVMLEQNTFTQTSTSFGLDCRMHVIL